MELSEMCVFINPRIRKIALNERDKQFYLDDIYYGKNKILLRPVFYPTSKKASQQIQDLEITLEKKLRTKYNC
jgi:hypothetical protein